MGHAGALALAAWLGRSVQGRNESSPGPGFGQDGAESEDDDELIGGVSNEPSSRLHAVAPGYVCPLRTVYLGGNRLGVRSVLQCPANLSLLLLIFVSCPFSLLLLTQERGAAMLSSALKRSSCPLKVLDIHGNAIGPSGCILVASALRTNHCLTSLDVSHNSVGPEGAVALAKAFMYLQEGGAKGDEGVNGKGLTHLNLWDNGIREEGRRALKALIRSRRRDVAPEPTIGGPNGQQHGRNSGERSASVLWPVASVGMSVLEGLSRAHTAAQEAIGWGSSAAAVDGAAVERRNRMSSSIHVHYMY